MGICSILSKLHYWLGWARLISLKLVELQSVDVNLQNVAVTGAIKAKNFDIQILVCVAVIIYLLVVIAGI